MTPILPKRTGLGTLKMIGYLYILTGALGLISILIPLVYLLSFLMAKFLIIAPIVRFDPFNWGRNDTFIIGVLCSLSIILGALSIKAVEWLDQGKRVGRIIWVALLLLAGGLTLFNFISILQEMSSAYYDFDYSLLANIFWVFIYTINYRIATQKNA